MAQEQIEMQDQSQAVQNEQVQTQSESSPDIKVAPGIDNELDSALEKAFNITPEVEHEEEVKEPVKIEPKKVAKKEIVEEKKVAPLEIEEVPEKAPKDQVAWRALQNKSKAAHAMIVERDAEIAKLKQSLAERGNSTAKETEALKAQMEELKKFRAMVDLQADPEFISKYDEPINTKLNSIKSMLKDMEVTDEVINQIDFTNTKLMDTILDHVGQHQDKFKARKLQRNIEEFIDLNDKKEETLAEHKDKYKEYLENKKKEGFAQQSEAEGRILRHIENRSAEKDQNNNAMYPFMTKMEIPDTADEAARNRMNIHNNLVDAMHNKLNQFLSVQTPEERTDVAIAAVGAHYLNAQLKVALKQNAALQAELKKISVVSTENEDPKPKRATSNGYVDTDTALNDFFKTR